MADIVGKGLIGEIGIKMAPVTDNSAVRAKRHYENQMQIWKKPTKHVKCQGLI
jgi:hypothetical protein